MKKIILILIKIMPSSLILCFILPLSAKVLIFTFSYNKPEFIELQYKAFKKFLLDDHELIVFSDAQEEPKAMSIKNMCEKYAIKCIPIPQEIHNRPYTDKSIDNHLWVVNEYNAPSVLYSNVAQYALDTLGFKHDDIVVIFESDLFLIKEFSFYKYLEGCDLAGYNRQIDYTGNMRKIDFLWIGLICMNMKSLPNKTMFNVNCGFYNNIVVDCGGLTHYYIKYNPPARIKYFNKLKVNSYYCETCKIEKNYRCSHNTSQLKNLGFDDNTIKFIQQVPIDWGSGVMRPDGITGRDKRNIEFFIDNHFVHFNGAAGYANSSTTANVDIKQFYKDKTDAFLRYINDILYM